MSHVFFSFILFPYRQSIRGHHDKITDLAINDNNTVLMSSSEDGWIMFWDITPLQQHHPPYYHLRGCACLHQRFVCQLKFDSVNQLLYSVADDGYIHAWNIPLLDPMNQHFQNQIFTERELCVFSLNHSVNQVDLNSRSPNSVLFCDITPTGKYIASGTHDGSIFIWKIPDIERDERGIIKRVFS